jgi:pimeloyl-ACP methyl ester carboxylesterase
VPEVRDGDVTLHVEVDGSGEPVTVFAHGLTNSCRELAPFTPSLAGTSVRFCFRGHGHSSTPPNGYGFADLAADLEAGDYRLIFHPPSPFFRRVELEVSLDDGHYHVPLLVSPFGCASYRGS